MTGAVAPAQGVAAEQGAERVDTEGALMDGPSAPMMHKIHTEKKKEHDTATNSRGFSVSSTVGLIGRWSTKRLGLAGARGLAV